MDKGRGFLLVAFGLLSLVFPLLAQGTQRGFEFYVQYPALVIPEGREISLDVNLQNTGPTPEDVVLSVSGPEDWNGRFETSSYPTLQIKSVHLLPGQEEPLTVRFKAKPPEGTPGGDYAFTLSAVTKDGALQHSIQVTVALQAEAPQEEEQPEETLQLLVDYPSLENAAGKDFSFAIQIKNQTDKDQMVELAAQVPFGWRAYFTPRWEQDTRITSIKVDAHGTENIRFVVTPPYMVEKGEYPMKFVAKAGEYQATLDLKAVVTGTYDLGLLSEAEVTGAGDTWNIKAVEGKARHFTLYLHNGLPNNPTSAPVTNVKFYATKPQGWEVEFKPETVESLPPTMSPNDLGKVDVIITPPDRAIPGDYQITINASGREDHESAQLRVTVGASMGWGWVGVGVVVVVVAALTGVFVRLGRR